MRSDDDPDGEVDLEGDLESILDEMLGASIPQRTLNLHYRSRKRVSLLSPIVIPMTIAWLRSRTYSSRQWVALSGLTVFMREVRHA